MTSGYYYHPNAYLVMRIEKVYALDSKGFYKVKGSYMNKWLTIDYAFCNSGKIRKVHKDNNLQKLNRWDIAKRKKYLIN